MKKLDLYIIRKYLGTFFFSIVLILSVAIVFDLTEKMDDFFENQLTWKQIISEYYIHFIPYYGNMFSSLFIFISVIFFTSKLAGNSEIIAMTAAGVSFHRLMRPYWICATLLCLLSFWMSGWVIPPASKKMLSFTDQYISHFSNSHARNIQLEVEPGTILYIESFQIRTNMGYRTSLEHFEGKTLRSRITADRIRYDSLDHWHLEQYTRRDFEDLKETLTRGTRLDTILDVLPEELLYTAENAEMMTNPELYRYIGRLQQRAAGNDEAFLIEWHKRWASPIAAFIMTLLAVCMSCRKVRGGMGKNLGIGLALSAAYILFSTISTTFCVSGTMSPWVAAWMPNIVFLAIGIFLYTRVRK